MRTHRLQGAVGLILAAASIFALSPPLAAAASYEIDIEGTLEILGVKKSGEPGRALDEDDVEYRVLFQYQDPGASTVGGVSALDQTADVTDGVFEVRGLQSNKVYRVSVERIIFSSTMPGHTIKETIPLEIPEDYFLQTPVAAGAVAAPVPVQLEMALGGKDAAPAGRALSFFYDGKDLMLSAATTGEPVS